MVISPITVLVEKKYFVWKQQLLGEIEVGFIIDLLKRHYGEENPDEHLCRCK
jgi:hypothetical protein